MGSTARRSRRSSVNRCSRWSTADARWGSRTRADDEPGASWLVVPPNARAGDDEHRRSDTALVTTRCAGASRSPALPDDGELVRPMFEMVPSSLEALRVSAYRRVERVAEPEVMPPAHRAQLLHAPNLDEHAGYLAVPDRAAARGIFAGVPRGSRAGPRRPDPPAREQQRRRGRRGARPECTSPTVTCGGRARMAGGGGGEAPIASPHLRFEERVSLAENDAEWLRGLSADRPHAHPGRR